MRKHGIRRQGDLLKLLEPAPVLTSEVLKSTVPLLATLLLEAVEAGRKTPRTERRWRQGIMDRISADHLSRQAFVYIRQSTPDQLRYHHESRHRQYGLTFRARKPGWAGGDRRGFRPFGGRPGRGSRRQGGGCHAGGIKVGMRQSRSASGDRVGCSCWRMDGRKMSGPGATGSRWWRF